MLGVFAVAYGVVADIASPAERGSFVGAVSLGYGESSSTIVPIYFPGRLMTVRTNSAPSIGPMLGGLIASHLGWQWIFWFLAIVSGLCCVTISFTLPETSRDVVGNGSMQARGFWRRLIPNRTLSWRSATPGYLEERQGRNRLNPLRALSLLQRTDTAINIVTIGVLYMTYSCLQASLSSLFVDIYQLSESNAGLIYLTFGIGCLAAAYLCGRYLFPSLNNYLRLF